MRLVTLDVLAPFPARLLAARLGAEGIVWQLRGESSVYPFGSVEVLVEADHVEWAREVAGLGPLPLADPADPADLADAADQLDPAEQLGLGTRPGAAHRLGQVFVWLAVLAIVVGLALRVVHVG